MAKKMKAFLSRWVLSVLCPMIAILWGVVTYMTFATPQGREDPGMLGWLVATFVLALVGVMLWLMTGRLPAYVIEIEDTDERKPS